ncbi:hypothetical protein [Shouchella clausii]|uniref:hypothetical protein n=1 Tax=Shouchella clausii TaxID=79880 RepID=UPI001C73B622|nr:hypothetical protein [Shouchella clausii]MBX0320191.1 hypothetical protein [Shouchella clausii]MEB5480794.1 hypothetical protein [Shouchella clausii]
MTPYNKIRDRFLSKIDDNSLLSLPEEELNIHCDELLHSAIAQFIHCYSDLSLRNSEERFFLSTLTELEIEILASYMVINWLNPKLQSEKLMDQSLGNRDYQLTSQANHLVALKTLLETHQQNVTNLIADYYYSDYERENE